MARYIEFCQNTLFSECFPGTTWLEPISRIFSHAAETYKDPAAAERDPFRYVEELGIREAAGPMQETIYSLPIVAADPAASPSPVNSVRRLLAQLTRNEYYAIREAPILVERERVPCFYNSVVEVCASYANLACEKLHAAITIIERCLCVMMDLHPEWDPSASSSSSVSLVPATQSQDSQSFPPKKKAKVSDGDNENEEEDDDDDDGEEEEEEEASEESHKKYRKHHHHHYERSKITRRDFSWLLYNSRIASKFCDIYCTYYLNKSLASTSPTPTHNNNNIPTHK